MSMVQVKEWLLLLYMLVCTNSIIQIREQMIGKEKIEAQREN